jgi:hypothetical protein
MSQINFAALTLNSEEARSANEVVFEQLYSAPEIASVHDIQTGVEMDRYIPLLGQYGLLGKIDPGSCSVNSEEGVIPVSQKQWTPKLHSFRLAHCQADVPQLLKFWKRSRIAANTWEEVDDEMLAFITDRAVDATKQAILRLSDFGNTGASPVGDGLGDETLTAGTNKTYFNSINGMWQQVFTDQAGAALIYRHTITENGEATKAAQFALADTVALDSMRNMYDNIDPRAFEGRNLVFQITRSLFNNWVALLEDKALANAVFQKVEEGSTQWNYRGIPIVVRNDWDRIIKAYHDLGLTYYLPHRAVLTNLGNIPIGTSDTESLTELRSFYYMKDKKHYMDVAFKLDMKILEEYAMAVAY